MSVKEYSDSNTTADLEEFLQGITLMRDIDALNDADDYVNVMTVHSAKGLEFKVVFIVGLNDGLFPLARAINSQNANDLEEERRLMYVAITRARERLYLTRARTRFNFEKKCLDYTQPSRFLVEIASEPQKLTASDIVSVDYGKREKTDYNLSSKINFVNVSGNGYQPQDEIPTSMLEGTKKPTINYSLYKRGTKVRHPHFGDGVVTIEVTDFAGGFVTVNFDSVGSKTLSLKYAKLEIID